MITASELHLVILVCSQIGSVWNTHVPSCMHRTSLSNSQRRTRLPSGNKTSLAAQDKDQPQRREQWFMHGRTIPKESAAALRYRAHQHKMRLRTLRSARNPDMALTPQQQADTVAGWRSLGPAPLASDATGFGGQDYGWVSGRATAVAIDLADTSANTVYLGGAYGGVWKSTNAGPLSLNPGDVLWVPLIDNQATLSVGSVAIQPGNNNPANSVILVGTGETNSSADSYYGLGILRSADAGSSWTLISQDITGTHPFAGLGFSKIAFSTSNPNLVVAAAAGTAGGVVEGLEIPVNTNRGLYYSLMRPVLELRNHYRCRCHHRAEFGDDSSLQSAGRKIFGRGALARVLFVK
jgi:hypothetical protein